VREGAGRVNAPVHAASVYFPTGTAELSSEAFAVLWEVVERYRDAVAGADDAEFVFQGSADYQGSEAFNDGLSRRRADAVASFVDDQLGSARAYRSLVSGAGEEEEPELCDPEGMGLARRVDIIVYVTSPESSGPDPAMELEDAKVELPILLGRAIRHLQNSGGARGNRAARLLQQLQKPGVDDSYFDEGGARRYVLQEMAHAGIRPDDMASRAMRDVLNAARYAHGDVEKFAEDIQALDDGIFYGLREIWRLYQNNGDAFRSSRVLNSWAEDRQDDSGHIYFAHRE
jgi:hypothetical protein